MMLCSLIADASWHQGFVALCIPKCDVALSFVYVQVPRVCSKGIEQFGSKHNLHINMQLVLSADTLSTTL